MKDGRTQKVILSRQGSMTLDGRPIKISLFSAHASSLKPLSLRPQICFGRFPRSSTLGIHWLNPIFKLNTIR